MHAYIVIIFDMSLFEGFKGFLNSKREILNWYRMENIYAVISECSVDELVGIFNPYFDKKDI